MLRAEQAQLSTARITISSGAGTYFSRSKGEEAAEKAAASFLLVSAKERRRKSVLGLLLLQG